MKYLITVKLILFVSLSCLAQEKISPPKARIILHVDTAHSEVRIDPFSWIRDKNNPEAINYLKQENDYAESIMISSASLQDSIFMDLKSRRNKDDSEPLYKMDSYYYYHRNEKKANYQIICRKGLKENAKEEIVLDVNKLAKGYDYFDLGKYIVSPDHSKIAYLYDTDGSEHYTLKIQDLQNDLTLDEEISNVGGFTWSASNQTLFYTTLSPSSRPDKLFRHQLGTSISDDSLVIYEPDNSFYLNPTISRDKKYILICNKSLESNEYYYLDAYHPSESPKLLFPRKDGIEYSVEHLDGKFFVRSNQWGVNFELFTVDAANPDLRTKRNVLPHNSNFILKSFELFKEYLVYNIEEKGLNRFLVIQHATQELHHINIEEDGYVMFPYKNYEFDTKQFHFLYSSLTTPWTYYDYNFDTRNIVVRKQQEIQGYNPTDYEAKRIWVKVKDGTEIPISIVFKTELKNEKSSPMLLTGYGAYGSTLGDFFRSDIISLLDRGFIYGIAHIRGGGYMGKEWFNQGKLLNKKNSFSDFISCSEYLINQGYTSSDKLAIEGTSAGGLLMGAVANIRPDLFNTVIALVPWTDVLNDMFDPKLPATPYEWKHIGNPEEKIYYDYIKSYSPYDNVSCINYPNIYVTAGLNDPRVFFWEPAKWVAKLRALKTDDNIIILKTDLNSGHFGETNHDEAFRKRASEFAFVLQSLLLAK